MKSVVIRVFGLVQKVYFRVSTQRKATALELTGWVRNRLNGSVEIFAYGNEKKIEELIQWSQTGPQTARVDRIEFEFVDHGSIPSLFEIRQTV